MKIFSKIIYDRANIIRKQHSLTNKIYPGGPPGRCAYNGRTITVFGSTGLLGSKVVSELARLGTQIICPYRCSFHDATYLKIAGDLGQIHLYEYDPYDYESTKRCIQYSDTVINCLGQHRYPHVAKKSNIDVPKMIADVVSESPNVKSFIHVSAMSQSSTSNDLISKTKHYGEKIVRSIYPNVVVIRPSTLYDFNDYFLNHIACRSNAFFRILLHRVVKVNPVKMPTWAMDVALAIVKIAIEGGHDSRTYQLYADGQYYINDILNFIFLNNFKFFSGDISVFLATFISPFIPNDYLCGITFTPTHLFVNDIPSTDSNLFSFKDLNMIPRHAEEGIKESLAFTKIQSTDVPASFNLNYYENSQLRLIDKATIDKFLSRNSQ